MSTAHKEEKTLVPPAAGETMVTNDTEREQADIPPSTGDGLKKAEILISINRMFIMCSIKEKI